MALVGQPLWDGCIVLHAEHPNQQMRLCKTEATLACVGTAREDEVMRHEPTSGYEDPNLNYC
jgi:hypothetical protein